MFDFFKKKQPEVRTLDATSFADLIQGNSISKYQALEIPSVATAVDFICSTIASCKIKLYKDNVEVDDYRLRLLNLDTEDALTAYQMKYALLLDYLLCGNGYIYVNYVGNKIQSLHYIDERNVTYLTNADVIFKSGAFQVQGRDIPNYLMMRLTRNSINGGTGFGFIQDCQQLLKTMQASMKYEYQTMLSANKRGFLQSEYKLDKESLNALQQAWKNFTSSDTQDEVLVLNKGISYTPSQSNASETQLNQSRISNNSAVLGYFGLSENFLTGGNSESYINNIKTAIIPLCEQMNNMFNTFMLLESEKDEYFFKIDTTELLKTTLSDRYSAYSTAISSGVLQVDEVRKMENLEPLGLDFVKLSLGDVMYYPKTGKIFTPNTGQTVDKDNSDKSNSDWSNQPTQM